jgi:hypothetical protein
LKPKDLREKLFWQDKPAMRPWTPEDAKWFKVAAKFSGQEIPDDFEAQLAQTLNPYQEVLVLEDSNRKFGQKFGPVGVVGALTNGYLYQPHVEWFPWATPKNKLRASVMFFQKFRYRDLGVIRVHTIEPYVSFFKKLKKYVPLFYVARIPGGDEFGRGDDFIFYMKCRGSDGRIR